VGTLFFFKFKQRSVVFREERPHSSQPGRERDPKGHVAEVKLRLSRTVLLGLLDRLTDPDLVVACVLQLHSRPRVSLADR